MGRYDILRQKLFDKYTRNWELITPYVLEKPILPSDFGPRLVCPICTYLFNREGLNKKYSDHLTLEDAPPKSIGGKAIVLTCKKCNNKAGGEVDNNYRLYKAVESIRKKEDTATVNIEIIIKDILKTRGYWTYYKDRDQFELRSITNEYNIDKLRQLRNDRTEISFDFKFQQPAQRLANITLLKAAYLIAFERFGYAYIYNSSLNLIREQIRNPAKQLVKNSYVLKPTNNFEKEGLFIIVRPKELLSLLVVFKTKINRRIETHGIVLPSVNDFDLNIYGKLDYYQRLKRFTFDTKEIPNENFITDPKLAIQPFLLWNTFNS